MTVEAPKWLQSANIIKVEDREHELRPDSLLLGLKEKADTSEKENFEKEMNKLLAKVAKLVFPEMEDPYYKWTGEVVDRVRNDGDDDGRWVTTENDHKVHINENGEPDMGNPHVIEAMKRGGLRKADEEYISAARDSDNAIEFWLNLSEEQQKRVGKEYKEVYERVKKHAGERSEWVEPRGKVSDMPVKKLEKPTDPMKFKFKEKKNGNETAVADADLPGEINIFTSQGDLMSDHVFYHEMGHQLSHLGLGTDILWNPGNIWGRYNRKKKFFESPYGNLIPGLSPEESFAELFSDYIQVPDHVKEKAPNVYNYFSNLIEKNSWIREWLKESHAGYENAVKEHKSYERADAKDEDGRWVTTENGHHVHINDEGEPDKGNPHVVEVMEGKTDTGRANVEKYGKTHAERLKKRAALKNACQEGLRGYRPVLKSRREILEAKRSYVRDFDRVQKELSVLEGVTKENLEAKKRELDKLIEEADEKEFEAEEATYDWTNEKDKRSRERDYAIAKERALEARRNRRLLNDLEFNKERLESVKENRKSYDLEYEHAAKEYDDAKAHMEGIVDRYNRQVEEMNRAILAKYPDYDSIKSADDVSEYLTAKGYFQVTEVESRMHDTVKGEPKGGTAKFDGCDLSVAKSMCKLCDSLYDRFPEMIGKIGGIYLNESEDAGGSVRSLYSGISLSKDRFGKADGFDDYYSGTYHPAIKGTSENQKHAAVLSHEFGHMLDFYLAEEKDNGIGDYVTYYDPETGMSREVFSVGPAILKKAAYNLGISKTDLKSRISGYACKNDVEALAEAFSEFIASDEPRSEAIEIGRQILALYNTGKLAGKEKKK